MTITSNLLLSVALLGVFAACDGEDGAAATELEVLAAWKAAGIEAIDLAKTDESTSIKAGECMKGTAAGLHVRLCTYKDALAADSAKEAGLATIGANTGTALVRDRYLLVMADIDKVDVHGKTLNKMAKIFLTP